MSTQQATNLFQDHREELGFVNSAQVEEKTLVTERRNGEVVGAALANHCTRKPQTTLYELAVDESHRRRGVATALVKRLYRDSPHDKLVAKCPVDLPANSFYEATGWDNINTESGKNRSLNVWEYTEQSIDVMTTGRPDFTAYAKQHGWLTGCRLDAIDANENKGRSPEFIDMHWDEPDRDMMLTKCMQHEPSYAIAGDYDGDNTEAVNDFADQLSAYVDNVIVVPHKPGEVDDVPEEYIVGYSTPTKYAGTEAPIWEYTGRDVHILGGTMNKIKHIIDHLRNDIVSLDTNTMHRDATQFGEYWSISQPTRKPMPETEPTHRKAYENGVLNMTYALEQWGMI